MLARWHGMQQPSVLGAPQLRLHRRPPSQLNSLLAHLPYPLAGSPWTLTCSPRPRRRLLARSANRALHVRGGQRLGWLSAAVKPLRLRHNRLFLCSSLLPMLSQQLPAIPMRPRYPLWTVWSWRGPLQPPPQWLTLPNLRCLTWLPIWRWHSQCSPAHQALEQRPLLLALPGCMSHHQLAGTSCPGSRRLSATTS